MSSYVNWFIKDNEKENVFAYFDGYSRGCAIYRIFDKILNYNIDEYGRALPVSKANLQEMIMEAKDQIDSEKAFLNRIKENCELVMQSNNTLEEKMEYINSHREHQEEIEEDMEGLQYAYYFFKIMDNIQYGPNSNYVYAGVEAIAPDDPVDEIAYTNFGGAIPQ